MPIVSHVMTFLVEVVVVVVVLVLVVAVLVIFVCSLQIVGYVNALCNYLLEAESLLRR